MQTTTAEHLDAEAERTAGIIEDRHEHETTQARRLAEAIWAGFEVRTPRHWDVVADGLLAEPERLDTFASDHGLPRPTDAVKCRTIAVIRSMGLRATITPSIIPASFDRPVCVRVAWLAEHPDVAAHLEYFEGDTGEWRPAAHAVRSIDPGWPVEVRQAMTVVGA